MEFNTKQPHLPSFKFVVLIGFRDDSWVFLNVFLNGHNIKRVHLCSKLKPQIACSDTGRSIYISTGN
jgi:hypothetical protein